MFKKAKMDCLKCLNEEYAIHCRPISKEASLYVKGGAILLMLIAHIIPGSCVAWHSFNIFTGVCCLGFFAALTGYAHFILSEKYNSKSSWTISGASFWKFFKKYLVCCLFVLPLYLSFNRIRLYDALWVVVPIKSYVLEDSWWYVFCHAVFCFALFPAVRFVCAKLAQKEFIVFISVLSICLILLPLTFNDPHYPHAFRQMWGSLPILRTILIVPYYLMGYAYGKCVHGSSYASLLPIVFTLVLYSLFPFSSYGISGISAINIGSSFIICVIALRVMYKSKHIQNLLKFLGIHSVYIWFLHMPICFFYNVANLPTNPYFRFVVVLLASLACSIVILVAGKRLSGNCSA